MRAWQKLCFVQFYDFGYKSSVNQFGFLESICRKYKIYEGAKILAIRNSAEER